MKDLLKKNDDLPLVKKEATGVQPVVPKQTKGSVLSKKDIDIKDLPKVLSKSKDSPKIDIVVPIGFPRTMEINGTTIPLDRDLTIEDYQRVFMPTRRDYLLHAPLTESEQRITRNAVHHLRLNGITDKIEIFTTVAEAMNRVIKEREDRYKHGMNNIPETVTINGVEVPSNGNVTIEHYRQIFPEYSQYLETPLSPWEIRAVISSVKRAIEFGFFRAGVFSEKLHRIMENVVISRVNRKENSTTDYTEAFANAFTKTIDRVGIDTFKKTSMFGKAKRSKETKEGDRKKSQKPISEDYTEEVMPIKVPDEGSTTGPVLSFQELQERIFSESIMPFRSPKDLETEPPRTRSMWDPAPADDSLLELGRKDRKVFFDSIEQYYGGDDALTAFAKVFGDEDRYDSSERTPPIAHTERLSTGEVKKWQKLMKSGGRA